jgi:uncharacterized protein
MFNLLPKDTTFYDLFESLAEHGVSTAGHLRKLASNFPSNLEAELGRIRSEEHAADEIAHKALDRLDQTFITPFDREDIHQLVGQLDDIIDTIDALAKRFPIYHITGVPQAFVRQTSVLVEATIAVRTAVQKLRKTSKLSELRDLLIQIHDLESQGDDINHAAVSDLFSGKTDVLEVMKWKELYDMIEGAIDGCEDVGNTLERIVLKNG